MRKQRTLLLILTILVLVLCSVSFVACNKAEPITIVYMARNVVYDQITIEDNVLVLPVVPLRKGFTFKGWYIDDETFEIELNQEYIDNLDSSTLEDFTLTVYAKWEKVTSKLYFEEDSEGNYKVSEYHGSELVVHIPERYNGKPVTTIGAHAFTNNSYIVNVEIPSSVVNVEAGAFSNCTSLKGKEHQHATYIGSEANPYLVLLKGDSEELVEIKMHPDTIAIAGGAFENYKALNRIEFPTNLKSIGDFAFRNCYYIEELTLPNSIEEIGYGAFERCNNLKSLTLPTNLKTIKDNAFMNCYSIAGNLVIPDNVTKIGANAFSQTRIESVEMKDNVKVIGESAFNYCFNLNSVTLSNSLEEIGDEAFKTCLALNEIVIPASVKRIGSLSFATCMDLKSVTFSPDAKLETIGSSAFTDCGFKDIIIPDSVKEIEEYAFQHTSIQNIQLPNNLKTISEGTFMKTYMPKITIPASVKRIERNAFYGHAAFEIEILGEEIELAKDSFNNLKKITAPNLKKVKADGSFVKFPAHSKPIDENDDYISEGYCIDNDNAYIGKGNNNYYFFVHGYKINENTKVICENSFEGEGEVIIPSGVETISGKVSKDGIYVILEGNLKEIKEGYNHKTRVKPGSSNIALLKEHITSSDIIVEGESYNEKEENGVRYYGTSANPYFKASRILDTEAKSVTINSRCEVIGIGCFSSSDIESISLPDSIESIEREAFRSCKYLTSITLPPKVKVIGSEAFMGCSSLKEVKGLEQVRKISYRAFAETALEDVALSDNIKLIEDEAFANCNNLKSFKVSENVKGLQSIFKGSTILNTKDFCEGFTKIPTHYFSGARIVKAEFPETVTLIEDFAFSDIYQGVSEIVVPKTVKKIGNSVFQKSNIISLKIEEGVEEIGDYILDDNDLVTELIIPNSVLKIGEIARYCTSLSTLKLGANTNNYWYEKCPNLVDIQIDQLNPYYIAVNSDIFSKDKEIFIKHCPNKNEKYYVVPYFVKFVAKRAFKESKFNELDLGRSLIGINQYTQFGDAKKINIHNSLRYIDQYSLSGENEVYYKGERDYFNKHVKLVRVYENRVEEDSFDEDYDTIVDGLKIYFYSGISTINPEPDQEVKK